MEDDGEEAEIGGDYGSKKKIGIEQWPWHCVVVVEFPAGSCRMLRRIDLNNQANRSILAVLFLFRRARRESRVRLENARGEDAAEPRTRRCCCCVAETDFLIYFHGFGLALAAG